MGGHSQWENVAIQEGFKTQEGLRIRASHCISDDVGKTEMSGNTRPLKVGRSAYIPVRLAKSLWTKVTMLSVHLPHSVCKISDFQDTLSEIQDFFCETDEEREYCWAWTAMWAWQEFGTKTW